MPAKNFLIAVAFVVFASPAFADDPKQLAASAQAVLKTHCYRCHGQDGAIEGGINYVTDLGKLVARKKIVPNEPNASRLFRRMDDGTMPPPGEKIRPTVEELEAIKKWIAAGASGGEMTPSRPTITTGDAYNFILADLETMDRRTRRFQRYFSLAHLHNAGLSDEELQTYRNALNKLVNSLSWGSKVVNPVAIDPLKTVLRIDLRWYVWDATIWNRILQEYPYGILEDTTAARAASVGTLTKVPVIRADWFVATASRAPLYYDVLQLPASITEVEKLLRVDAIADIQQERVARAAFNGSGISRFNRILERHDSAHGMYWRTYDFDEPPANLGDRLNGNLVPDQRNVFAFPLGPAGLAEFPFKHAGGEAIFALPNGMHAYYIMNANNNRLDKAPQAIVSDPKRPDRAVEAGVSCMSCHVTGILPKADQVLDHLTKNPKAFTRAEGDLIKALYPGKDTVIKQMEDDAKKYAETVAKTGARVSKYEAVSTITLKYEADLDLETAAAEVGLTTNALREKIDVSETLRKHFGALRAAGGTVSRQIWLQAFGDLTRELRLGTLFLASLNGPTNADNTGEIDPLESRDGTANQMAFAKDGLRAVVASGDRSVRLWDVEGRRDVKRFVGHTGSVWSVALSADGKYAISGSMDGTARVWDMYSGLQVQKYGEHSSLVSAVAFNPNGRWGISAGFDGVVAAWKVANGEEIWRLEKLGTVTAIAVDPTGSYLLVASNRNVEMLELATGKTVRTHGKFASPVVSLSISPNGKWYAAGSDDGTTRVWKLGENAAEFTLTGHDGPVRSVTVKDGGRWVLTAGADSTVRLWDTAVKTGAVATFKKHGQPVVSAAFLSNGTQTLSGDRDMTVLPWKIDKFFGNVTVEPPKRDPVKDPPDKIPYAKP
ncbi:MAG: WD40 repeat domain-containing protein [Planctomycetes bacterium]|nr:WD40 repeat domain-containing protein [Planctomycetota bacterium]